MALTKVSGDFIKDGSITQGHLHASHGITTSDIGEGSNLYFTTARVNTAVGNLSTSDLSEGTNLYYTNARADARIALQVGSNLDLSSKSTSDLSEGTNLYYTQARFNTAFAAKSTSDLSEGTNLYYTDARVGSYLTTNSYATQSYVNTQVSNLVDSAPSTLDTLNELAAALGDDANFSTTVTNSIATKLPLAGGTLTGALSGTSATFSGIGQFAGALKITETGTAQHILIGNQDSGGVNKPGMIRSANASLEFGYGNSWSGEGGTMTTSLTLHSNSNASFAGAVTITTSGSPGLKISKDRNTDNRFLRFNDTGTSGKDYDIINNGNLAFYNHTDNNYILQITSGGNATFTGTLTASGYNKTNWDTAYGWGNHASAGYFTNSGSWLGDLGSYSYTREHGIQMTGGSEFVILSKSGQGSVLVDGHYMAYESNNGFFGSYNSAYGNLTGIRATAANTLKVIQLDGGVADLDVTQNTYANVYYDRNNTAYYINPNGPSQFNRLTLSGSGTANSATLEIDNPSSSTFNHSIEAFAANLTNGESNVILVGKEGSTKNSGYLGYYWTSAGSNNNYVSLGHWAADHLFRVYGDQVLSTVTFRSNVDVQSPIFYDKDNTGYYVDPNSTSNLYGLTVNQTISGTTTDALRLTREDNRTISPSELTAGRLKFGFTSWANNNSSPYADFLHMRSYTDSSGGNDTLLMVKKANPSGVRVWNQSWGSSTAYSNYIDLLDTSSNNQVKSGRIQSNTSLRAPIFYSSSDTSYYLYPNNQLSLKVYGEICNSNYAQGNLQPGALNLGRIDTDYRWTGSTWNSDVKLGMLLNFSEYYEIGLHDSGDSVNSFMYYNGTDFEMGRDIGWGTQHFTFTESVRTPIYYDSNNTGYYIDPASDSVLARADINGGANYPLQVSSSQRYMIQARNTGNTVNSGYGWWWFTDTDFDMGFHADGAGDRLTLTRDGDLIIGQTSVSYTSNDNTPVVGSNTTNRLHVNGSIQLTNNNDALVIGRGTASFFKDEEIGFGWGGGWYMTDGTYLRVRNNKAIYSTGSVYAGVYYDSNDTNYFVNPNSGSRLVQLEIHNGTTGNQKIEFKDTNTSGYGALRFFYNNSEQNTIHAFGSTWSSSNWPNASAGAINLSGYNGITIGGWSSPGAWVYNNGQAQFQDSVRSPIFYDSNNTGYYINPYGQSKIRNNDAQETLIIEGDYPQLTIRRTSIPDASIHFDAGYAKKWNVGPGAGGAEDDEFGFAIYSGPRGTHYGTPVRINAETQNVMIGDVDHPAFKLDVRGQIRSTSDIRGTIFYDENNTSYYTNPDGTSNIYGLTVNQQISGSIDGASNSVAITGYGNGNFTFNQTSNSFNVFSGWHNYLICNHGNGSNYYNTIIAMPFWGAPKYSRLEGGTQRGPYDFWTSETQINSSQNIYAPVYYEYNNTTYYLDAANTGDSIRVAGDVVAFYSSDERYKDNVKEIEDPIKKVKAIRGVTFDWNEKSHKETGKKDIGVIAQEVEKVLPEIVQTRENGYKAVDYQKITALLIEVVKKQQEQIDELKNLIK